MPSFWTPGYNQLEEKTVRLEAENSEKRVGIYIMFPKLLVLADRRSRKARIALQLRRLAVGDREGPLGRSGLVSILFPLLCPKRSDFILE